MAASKRLLYHQQVLLCIPQILFNKPRGRGNHYIIQQAAVEKCKSPKYDGDDLGRDKERKVISICARISYSVVLRIGLHIITFAYVSHNHLLGQIFLQKSLKRKNKVKKQNQTCNSKQKYKIFACAPSFSIGRCRGISEFQDSRSINL